jgi:hypothetical protein
MRTEEYLALERMLDKLRSDLGYRFVIACSTHDMYTIGIYDVQGDFIASEVAPTIEESVKKLKSTAQAAHG